MKKEIRVLPGDNIESVVHTLLAAKAKGESVYAEFNGHKLYSDTVSMDSAYIEITGQTKEDFELEREKTMQTLEQIKLQRKEDMEKAQEKIPSWIQRGQELIYKERHEDWKKCVLSRASDIYHGAELDASLDIMQALENGVTIEEAKEMLDEQEHSGMSASLVRNILFSFSSKGPEFWEATSYGEISPNNKMKLKIKKEENLQLAKINAKKTYGLK